MNANELRRKYIDFFVTKGHAEIPSASLVPENDPSVLFTTAGMHPLVPYLMGEKHPAGNRLVDYQKCVRTGDIDEVGDNTHLTFFEMLGNWSLGDYFKDESIEWSYEFLTSKDWLGIDVDRLAVSVFAGDDDAPFDQEAFDKWIALGIPEARIAKLGKDDNWWPAGGKHPGPQGPDTEIFYWTGDDDAPEAFDPENDLWVEIWNNVFMQFSKGDDGVLSPLEKTNVDTGMGLERTLAVFNGKASVFETDLFVPIIKQIESISKRSYNEHERSMRIIADHIRTAVMMIADGVMPSNKDQGYILRRLIRRSVREMMKINEKHSVNGVVDVAADTLADAYPVLNEKRDAIKDAIAAEVAKFGKTLKKGLREFEKLSNVDGKAAFDLYQTYGFPLELTEEMAREKGTEVDHDVFEAEFKKHQDLSRTASAGKFKGGLADSSEKTTQLHTATHLMLAALRKYLGPEVHQAGSNITAERTRFDFTWPEKVERDVLDQVEAYVNDAIENEATVKIEVLPKQQAQDEGVEGSFWEKYPDQVNVYNVIGKDGTVYSRELCGGPHVKTTKGMGTFKIVKEQSSSAGIRRIKAILG